MRAETISVLLTATAAICVQGQCDVACVQQKSVEGEEAGRRCPGQSLTTVTRLGVEGKKKISLGAYIYAGNSEGRRRGRESL